MLYIVSKKNHSRNSCQPDCSCLSVISQDPDAIPKSLGVEQYRKSVRHLISTGHPTHAFDLVQHARLDYPNDHELTYLGALALARGGNHAKAMRLTAGERRLTWTFTNTPTMTVKS